MQDEMIQKEMIPESLELPGLISSAGSKSSIFGFQ